MSSSHETCRDVEGMENRHSVSAGGPHGYVLEVPEACGGVQVGASGSLLCGYLPCHLQFTKQGRHAGFWQGPFFGIILVPIFLHPHKVPCMCPSSACQKPTR